MNVVIGVIKRSWDLLSLQKYTLRETRVFDFGLGDVDGAIHQIIHDNTLSNSVVFIRVFNDGLLEVSIISKDLTNSIIY